MKKRNNYKKKEVQEKLIDKTVGNLTLIKFIPRIKVSRSNTEVLVRCICGTELKVPITAFLRGKYTSCKSSNCSTRPKGKNHYSFEDLSGQRFGQLTVLELANSKNDGRSRWRCLCDCGNSYIALAKFLRNGVTYRCNSRITHPRKRKIKKWKEYEGIPGRFWKTINYSAAVRNIGFYISIEFIWNLFLNQDRKCKLSGIPLYFSNSRRIHGNASLDRIDSSKPYTENNVQWVLKDINLMKLALSQEEFIEICSKIASYKGGL